MYTNLAKEPVMVGSPLWRTLAQGKQPSTFIAYITREWVSKLGTRYNLQEQKFTHLKTLTVATLNTTEHTEEYQEKLTAGIKLYKTIWVKLTTLKCTAIKPEIQGFKRVLTSRPRVNLPTCSRFNYYTYMVVKQFSFSFLMNFAIVM